MPPLGPIGAVEMLVYDDDEGHSRCSLTLLMTTALADFTSQPTSQSGLFVILSQCCAVCLRSIAYLT